MKYTSTHKLRANRRKAGLCFCGEPPRAGFTTCETCAKKQLAYSARSRAKKRQLGLCVCGEQLVTKFHCATCADRHSKRVNTLVSERIEACICPRCRGPNPDKKWCCDECQEKRRPHKKAMMQAWRAIKKNGWQVPREVTLALYKLQLMLGPEAAE
jgi:hypothetical protein